MPATTSTLTTLGIATDEAGTVTGEVEVTTNVTAEQTDVTVAYVGAKDTYRVCGAPVPRALDHAELVTRFAAEPPRDEHGNVVAHSLTE